MFSFMRTRRYRDFASKNPCCGCLLCVSHDDYPVEKSVVLSRLAVKLRFFNRVCFHPVFGVGRIPTILVFAPSYTVVEVAQ